MEFEQQIAEQLDIRPKYVSATIVLLDSDNTVPFIARYRKEATGGLDEDQLRKLKAMLESLRVLMKRRTSILKSITEQGKLTPELEKKLLSTESITALEDLYQPYKPKRHTRASIAREKGLEPLARLILAQPQDHRQLEEIAAPFLNDKVDSADEALAGARDIVAETISDYPAVRQQTRAKALRWAVLSSIKIAKSEDPRSTYKLYYEYRGRVDQLRPHQVLAVNRGEAEKVLRVKIEIPERDWRQAIASVFRPNHRSSLAGQLEFASDDAAGRLLLPAIERDIRRHLTEKAEEHAITVFAVNLRNLLLQPPLSGFTILGIDPGFRTGCKVAVVDPMGTVLDTTTIYPHAPQRQWKPAIERLRQLVRQHDVKLFAIGNGTASRETEQLIAELNQASRLESILYMMVNEAGASVYSASPLARDELPTLDVTLRGAVSIARRVQDPLAELVKIDPKSIGVGLYQHDVDQGLLQKTLDGVVESVVNQVGVDVNTASPALLTHVAGIGPKLAENIVTFRRDQGPFASRQALIKVAGLGPKSFEQAAGFLRIQNGDNPLDASAIHPESYDIAEAVLSQAALTSAVVPAKREPALLQWRNRQRLAELSARLGAGMPTLEDILEQLIRPGRDPRQDLPPPVLRSDILSMEDLSPGMVLKGTVRNVVDFGAFVDIGVKQDGLLHRSQWIAGAVIGVGDVIEVRIINVEPERGRISLGWSD
ncbi:MAG TPA: Tex family protein [Patescibacteria group bacterium]|nr:Tex family protein [Patescibacteria group bacterium]